MTSEPAVEGGLAEPTELEPEQGTLALMQPGDEHTREEWEAATAAVLRKSRRMTDEDPDDLVWKKLTRTTLDGIAIPPIGTRTGIADLADAVRPTRAGEWDIRCFGAAGDETSMNQDLLVDLEGGVTSLWLEVDADTDFAGLLAGVMLDLAPVVLDARNGNQVGAAKAFAAHTAGTMLHPATNLGVDARLVSIEIVELARSAGVLGFVVDAAWANDVGGSDAQELGYALAIAVDYLRTLEGAGVDVSEAAGLVEFRLAATADQFATIAKLRAARMLWERVQELSGLESPVAMRQHVVTSRPMMTRYDPWVNMLRTTVAAFAAGVGGADAVTVLPFDSALGRPDAFGRRIARNTSALLISESHVARVADPAGGAYAVERLTGDLAAAAWDLFIRIDDGDHPLEVLDPLIEDTVAARDRLVATRRQALTGLSEFPNLAETLPVREPYEAFGGVRGYGAAFEALRDDPPGAHVFLATLGTVAAHTARATFASNLLAAGGVAVDVAGATADAEQLVAAYDGQPVVCLAGSDPAYSEWGSAAAEALRGAGAQRVIIAGKPVDYADDSCAMGVDALDFLVRTRKALS